MLANVLLWLLIVVVTVLLGWLTWRAWRSRNGLVRWGGGLLAGLLTLVAAVGVGVIGRGLFIMYSAPPQTPAPSITVAGTPEQIARGKHLALSLCAGCHSASGPWAAAATSARTARCRLATSFPIT